MWYNEAMSTATAQKQPYMTIQEVADELGCQKRNVYKLIENKKLPVLKRSERKSLVPRAAFDAYVRRLNGAPSPVVELPVVDDDELFSQFVADTGGLTPQAFFTRFKSGEIEDTSENMTLLVKAVALGAGGSEADAPVHHETWARAAFTSVPDPWHG
jgi:excisionase family DNA binding protein